MPCFPMPVLSEYQIQSRCQVAEYHRAVCISLLCCGKIFAFLRLWGKLQCFFPQLGCAALRPVAIGEGICRKCLILQFPLRFLQRCHHAQCVLVPCQENGMVFAFNAAPKLQTSLKCRRSSRQTKHSRNTQDQKENRRKTNSVTIPFRFHIADFPPYLNFFRIHTTSARSNRIAASTASPKSKCRYCMGIFIHAESSASASAAAVPFSGV